ncbi:MAG: S24/S26 family peptidase [Phocaeicola sp.]
MSELTKFLESQGDLVQTVVGDSMEPLLHNRTSLVRIQSTQRILKSMDIALYQRPDGKLVLHRILKVKKDCYIICGDNRWKKERVPFSWILGVVIEFYNGEWIGVEAPEYIRYLNTLSFRRKKLWLRALSLCIHQKLKRMIL